MLKVVYFLLVGFLLTDFMIKSFKCQSNEPKCFKYLDELVEALGSKKPPINDSRTTDNYYNISRALFPSIDLPALYVRVTIQFLKDYQNGTKKIDDKTLKLTWSKACTYVSVHHISLFAMSVFSLATIFPQRRQTELTVTVPPLCKDSPYSHDNERRAKLWRYIVSTLEDITINSIISDPRINTVACVVEGHEEDKDHPIKYPTEESGPKVVVWDYCCLVLPASLLTSIVICIYLHNWLKEGMKKIEGTNGKDEKERMRILAGTILKMTIITFVITFVFIFPLSFIIHISEANTKDVNPYVIAYLAVISLFLIIAGCVFFFIPLKIKTVVTIIFFVITFVFSLSFMIYTLSEANTKDVNPYVIAYLAIPPSYIFLIGCSRCVYHFKVLQCLTCCCFRFNPLETEKKLPWWYELGFWLLFPSLFMSIHHFLWVLCGIISEPYWATPMFLIECLFGFSIMYSLYLYERDAVGPDASVKDGKCCVVIHLIASVVAFSLILLVVVFVGHGHIVNVTTAGVIEVIITITLMWLIKNSGLHLKSFTGNNNENTSQNIELLTSTNQGGGTNS